MKRSGWLTFSGVVLIVAGIMRVLDAVWAFRYNGTIADNLHQALFGHSLRTYGWIWLIVGAILIVSGFLVLSPTDARRHISRWVGIVAAGLAAITAVSWLPYYPVWSLVYVVTAMVVIYGLSAPFQDARMSSKVLASGLRSCLTGPRPEITPRCFIFGSIAVHLSATAAS